MLFLAAVEMTHIPPVRSKRMFMIPSPSPLPPLPLPPPPPVALVELLHTVHEELHV